METWREMTNVVKNSRLLCRTSDASVCSCTGSRLLSFAVLFAQSAEEEQIAFCVSCGAISMLARRLSRSSRISAV